MVTKAIIQEIVTPTSVRVRIPILNKIEDVVGSTPNSELPISSMCSLPNFVINPKVGDVVVVAFEEDNLSKPVILGYLSTSGLNGSLIDVRCDELTVSGATNIGTDIVIGEITYENLRCLKDLRESLIERITKINNAIDELAESGLALNKAVSSNTETIAELKSTTSRTERAVNNLTSRVSNVESDLTSVKNTYLKNPIVLNSTGYGNKARMDSLSPKEGQIFLLMK